MRKDYMISGSYRNLSISALFAFMHLNASGRFIVYNYKFYFDKFGNYLIPSFLSDILKTRAESFPRILILDGFEWLRSSIGSMYFDDNGMLENISISYHRKQKITPQTSEKRYETIHRDVFAV